MKTVMLLLPITSTYRQTTLLWLRTAVTHTHLSIEHLGCLRDQVLGVPVWHLDLFTQTRIRDHLDFTKSKVLEPVSEDTSLRFRIQPVFFGHRPSTEDRRGKSATASVAVFSPGPPELAEVMHRPTQWTGKTDHRTPAFAPTVNPLDRFIPVMTSTVFGS